MRRLRAGGVDLLVASPDTAAWPCQAARRSGDGLAAVLLAWPESWEDHESLTPLMQDLLKDAQRIVLTAAGGQADGPGRALRPTGPHPGPRGREGLPAGRTGPHRQRRRGSGAAAALAELVELLDPGIARGLDRRPRPATRRSGAAVAAGDAEVQVVTGDAPRAALIVAFDPPSARAPAPAARRGRGRPAGATGTDEYVARIASPRRPAPDCPACWSAVTPRPARAAPPIVRTLERGEPHRALPHPGAAVRAARPGHGGRGAVRAVDHVGRGR